MGKELVKYQEKAELVKPELSLNDRSWMITGLKLNAELSFVEKETRL